MRRASHTEPPNGAVFSVADRRTELSNTSMRSNGGDAQTRLNFEVEGLSTASFIRESQRLGLMDAGDRENTAYIPSDDEKIPQLHTKKKKELGLRAARWALQTVYGSKATRWDKVELASAVPTNGAMLLTFDQQLRPDDFGSEASAQWDFGHGPLTGAHGDPLSD